MKKLIWICGLYLFVAAWVSGADLVAHYSFDDAENLGKDSSGNGKDLSTNSGFKTPEYSAKGKFDGAAYFDGSSSWITSAGVYPQGSFTISAWVNPADTNISAVIEPMSRKGGAAIYLAGGVYRFRTFKSDGTFTYRIGDKVKPGKWQHLVMTFSKSNGPDRQGDYKGTYKIYMDGDCVASVAATYAAPADYAMKIGSYSAMAVFRGLIDEISIYNDDMSASEVKKLEP